MRCRQCLHFNVHMIAGLTANVQSRLLAALVKKVLLSLFGSGWLLYHKGCLQPD
jgi:hypothetical protein